MPESTVQHWDKLWAQHKDEPVHDRELAHIINYYKGSLKNKKVLETGAGSGGDSIALHQMTKCKNYCADYSAKSIAFLKKNFKKAGINDAQFIKADIRNIPVKDGTFDVIFSNGVLEHFRDPIVIMKEQKRVLKKGGLLVIGVPETYSLYTIKKQIQIRRGTWFAGWETQYSAGDMRRMAKKAGLKIVAIKVYGNAPLRFPPWLKKICTALRVNRVLASDVVLYATK